MSGAGNVPSWVQGIAGALVLLGAVMALIGATGVLRLPTFFQRVHATTLASTLGAWSIGIAAALYFSFFEHRLALHPLLVPALLALTVPVSTFFLMRAAVFRHRLAGTPGVPGPVSSPAEPATDAGRDARPDGK
ncbi:monovalent cation/H(+) antiporter subunit G [Xylophilus sp. GOD-11R]|uniref:monovalent cation/H(+) antiporter subunit G n=1 Tax=Xylophilus sp. GOD-11R TaxID=3089814 RepID=UPI00298C39B4|nr:monovalent cation/H(+) antiporter subunit G [Xylophilus sp. GOD-11R]WPB57876.1 monovalent cation/H(+) antiporter subunit G [Xylophilus sp. GOD-11R]